MAIKDEEGVPQKEKCIATPSASLKMDPPNGRPTMEDAPHGDMPKPPEKPKPNYLRPTLSSSHITYCHYPKKQRHHPEASSAAPAAATSSCKRLPLKTSVHEVCPPPARLQASPTSVGPSQRAARAPPPLSPSQKPAISKEPDSEKESKCPTTESIEAKPDVKEDRGKVAEAETLRSSTMPKSENRESGRPNASEESAEPTGPDIALSKKPRARVKTRSMSTIEVTALPRRLSFLQRRISIGNEDKEAVADERLKYRESLGKKAAAESVVLNRHEVKGRESPLASNAVVEETANVSGARRKKVKAPVGAFESVTSLHEAQPSQQREEVARSENGGSGGGQSGQQQQPDISRPGQTLPETEVTQKGEGESRPREKGREEESKDGRFGGVDSEDKGRGGVDSEHEGRGGVDWDKTRHNTTKKGIKSTKASEETESCVRCTCIPSCRT